MYRILSEFEVFMYRKYPPRANRDAEPRANRDAEPRSGET